MIVKHVYILFFGLFSAFNISAQTWSHYDWNNAPKLDKSVFDQANAFFKEQYKDHLYVGDLIETDAKDHSSGLYYDHMLGNIYTDFYGYESYIRNILRVIIKDTVAVNNLKIYFYYDPGYNMSMDALGNIRIYVGLFNYVANEAELAGVLAHEYGHFLNKDPINEHSDSKQQESTADYQAIKLIKGSPYSTKGLSNAFKTFKRFEIKAELLVGNNRVYNVTHPDPGDRLKQVKILSKDSNNIGKKLFVVDSLKFMRLKKTASQESFNIMVNFRAYQEIIELAFTHYLYYPNDPENLALLNESLRRYLLMDPKKTDKQFIISEYKGKGSKRSDNYKYVDDDHTSILNYLNKGLLHLQSNDLSKLNARELLDTASVKFTTNKEAYLYFSSKATEVNCKPCLISTVFKNEKKAVYDENAKAENTVFDCVNFLNDLKDQPNFTENLYVLNLPSVNDISAYEVNKMTSYTDFLKTYLERIKEKNGLKNIFLISDLPFDDQHRINSVSSLSESIVDPDLYMRAILSNVQYKGTYMNIAGHQNVTKSEKLNWKNFSPETYDVFSKYKVKNIYVINFDLYTFEVSAGGGYGFSIGTTKVKSRSWQFKKVSLDEKNIVNVVYQHNITTTKESRDESIEAFSTQLKWFLSANK